VNAFSVFAMMIFVFLLGIGTIVFSFSGHRIGSAAAGLLAGTFVGYIVFVVSGAGRAHAQGAEWAHVVWIAPCVVLAFAGGFSREWLTKRKRNSTRLREIKQ